MPYKRDSIVDDDIGCLVREMETNYLNGVTNISKYVQTSMYEDLSKIDAYLNSRHTTGEFDSQDREKPFFNIVTAAVNIWYRATDIDRKHIRVRATKSADTIDAFLATVVLQSWMRKINYGSFLNEWGRVLARYGSAIVKHVEQNGELIPMVVPWQRVIVDAVDFDANPKIEIIELTEGELYRRIDTHGYDAEMVEKLCDARDSRETIDKQQVDSKSDYIKLYEVHCYEPKSYLTGKEKDNKNYVQQMHVISFVASKEEGKFDDFTLVSGQESKDPYMITHLIKEDGQTLSIGAVQHLFEAQWMMNHTVLAIKNQLDLASKLIFQTSDGTFVGQNALSNIETGDILIHKVNEPLTQLNNNSHDITSLQNFGGMWKSLGNEIVGVSESMLGNTAPSGTAWRQVEALLQENHDLFELMTENKGLHIEDMLRMYVLPWVKKQLDTSKEVSAILEPHDIMNIDAKYIKNKANKLVNEKLKQAVLRGEEPSLEDQAMLTAETQNGLGESLSGMGSQRFFKPSEISDKTWKTQLKDLEWELEVDITGEPSFSKEDLATVSTLIQTMADPAKAAFFQTPEGRFLRNKVLTLTNTISPIELTTTPALQQSIPSPLQAEGREAEVVSG